MQDKKNKETRQRTKKNGEMRCEMKKKWRDKIQAGLSLCRALGPAKVRGPLTPIDYFQPSFWAAAPIGDEVLQNGEIFRLFVCPYVRLPPPGHPARPEAQPARPEAQPARSKAKPGIQVSGFRPGWLGFRPAWLGLRPGWMAQRGEWTNRLTENVPILQDFVPYQGGCPASPHENQGESRAGQGNC